MKVLISGAGGMLGTEFASVLMKQATVVGLGRRPAKHLKIPYEYSSSYCQDSIKKIIEEFQKGYMFRDKVIRYAKVKVLKK